MENKNEIWKNIPGYEGLYEVSNLGNVRSLNYGRTGKTHLLRPKEDRDGYLNVGLCKDGKRRFCQVHRLVAATFISNPLNKPTVNHKNEVKTDNSVDNLEWATMQEQNVWGTRLERYSISNSRRKVPVLVHDLEGNFVGRFSSQCDAARKLGIDQGNISLVLLGKQRSAHGYTFRRAS